MKSLLYLFLCLVILSSCSNEKGTVLPVKNTNKINESDTQDSIIIKAAHIVPTANQYEALKNEYIAFVHFGPNTFTRREWGSGMENPAIFNLQNLETDQWCEAMKAGGMKMVIITAKHHDGFCLWQSRYTTHGIMSSPYKNGEGDIMKELAESCKKYGLKLGVYLSPADLFQIESKDGLYGNLSEYTDRVIPRPVEGRPFENKTTFTFKVDDYNEYFLNQLFELLTEYGPIHEVWFDGAHPKRKGGQTYNYLAWKELIQKLAPEAVVFGKQDIRWCGNEGGRTRNTEWNVIAYNENPDTMNSFRDMTENELGTRNVLYKAKYLHYQPAETNTSIREGWFYRDDFSQKVRSASDIFDIYERSVGGNSIFLLNIPPNRDGRFSPRDVAALTEVGKRIDATYSQNLLDGASGPKNMLDNDISTYEVLSKEKEAIVITTPSKVTVNRFVLQEAVTTHSERIEEHALDAWIDNKWKEVAKATNIGYKRILRFPEVSSEKFRVRILKSRMQPAIANLSAHYYKPHPPLLEISSDVNGKVTIQAKKNNFGWNQQDNGATGKFNGTYEIRYTTDGSEPTINSKIYTAPFEFSSGEVKACSFANNDAGPVNTSSIGLAKSKWKRLNISSTIEKNMGLKAFDADKTTYWQSQNRDDGKHFIDIDLGDAHTIKGFAYTPQTAHQDGMIEKGTIKISPKGMTWTVVKDFEFGNLINDPTTRIHYFAKPVETRYIRIESKKIAGNGKSAAIAEIDFL